MKYTSIRPGEEWKDNNGKLIQAHGGTVRFFENKFRWFGENKEGVESENIIWHNGVRMYSSVDLYNWTDEGVICAPDYNDETSPLYPQSKMDRPHIIFNDNTAEYVMWIKIMGKDGIQYMVVAKSKKVTGPYELVNKKLHPCGMNSGDFDLVKDEETGKGYIVFDRVHHDLIVMDLTDDYMDVTDNYSVHFPRKNPPFVRESPAVFRRNKNWYMFTSGTTAKFLNPSEIAVSDNIHGPWKLLGDPHVNDKKHTSFDSQISCVFRYRDTDLYVAAADRWLMDLPQDMPDICAIFESMFDPEKRSELSDYPLGTLTVKNTSIARYVWLPINFNGDMPTLEWKDEWRIEDYMILHSSH